MRSTHTAKTYDNFQRRGAILLRKLAAPRTPDWLATSSAVRSKPGSSSRKRNLPTTCDGGGPAGLALLPGERLMTSCGTVLDARSGRVLANVTNPFDGTPVSGDEIWYNPGDDRVYFGDGSGAVTVVDASTYDLVRMSGSAVYFGLSTATIDTSPYKVLTYFFPFPLPDSPPLGTTFGGHSIAANSSNNHIFVPVIGAG